MNKLLVRLFGCLIIFAFLLPAPVAQAGFRNTAPSQTNMSELDQLPEQFIFLPLIMNGSLCSKAPTLLYPANSASLDNLIPLFRWGNGNDPNATEMHLQVASDAEFNQIFTSLWSSGSGDIKEFRFARNFEPSSTYFWRTFFKCGDTQSPYSEAWSFTTGSGGTILPAPDLIAPADDALLTSLSPDLQWSPVNGAVEYEVRWSSTGNLGGYGLETVNTNFTITWALDPSKTYDWWISARNDYAWGMDSEKWQFTTPAETQSLSQEHFSHIIYGDQGGEVIKSE